uniref:Myb-like domain-containing protein n=1 Tax=Glossina brevipalpis TaxID=37001 RepID=A0A1A9W970_9MUSC
MDKIQRSDEQLLYITIEEDGKDDVAVNKADKQHQLLDSGEEVSSGCNYSKPSLRGKEEKIFSKTDCKTKSEYEAEELLGSVITHNCLGTRTSARVIQKMKQDQQTRPGTPPPNERDTAPSRKDERTVLQKTPSQVRANKPSWNNLERNYFFDALNEFGKDFEAVGSYINTKLKRRNPASNISCKSKDQVRQHYYQTYHKICKYIQVRKPVQELYALINYGEMRRKLQFVTDKHFMKLRNLVYHGHITVRCKGKNIRIKTPSCKALRRLNQLDDSLEDIKLPSKIEVTISPANMEAFGRVQTIAQNPRCRTTVPLHKKLVNFIKAFQYKWRSNETKIAEEAKLCTNNGDSQISNGAVVELGYIEPEICFLPKPGVAIHRPLLSITEYLSSVNICLTAYEERIGVKIKGITLNSERTNSNSATFGGSTLTNPKRIRTESGSEKRSPDSQLKRQKPNDLNNGYETHLLSGDELLPDADLLQHKNESSGDELSDEIQELLSDSLDMQSNKEDSTLNEIANKPNSEMKDVTLTHSSNPAGRGKRPMNMKSSRSIFKPLLNEEVIQRIRSGWTISTASDITIGDLYVVLGHDSKLELDYYWPSENTRNLFASLNTCNSLSTIINDSADCALASLKPNILEDSEDCQIISTLNSSALSNKLKHLLLIANLSERLGKRQCQCERNVNMKNRIERELGNRRFLASKLYNCPNNSYASGSDNHSTFKPPLVPIRRPLIDPVKQLTNLTRQKMSRQVLVQRLLLPTNGTANHNTSVGNNTAHPIDARKCDIMETCQEKEDMQVEQIDCAENLNDDNNDTTNNKELPSPLISDEACLDINDLEVRLQNYLQETENIPNGQDLTSNANGSATTNNAFDECSNTSFLNALSPMQLLRESTSNSRWLEENLNDFSLTSLLGHLDEINASRDILDPSSNLSVISESSVDYMHKFQEIKALLQSQEKD